LVGGNQSTSSVNSHGFGLPRQIKTADRNGVRWIADIDGDQSRIAFG